MATGRHFLQGKFSPTNPAKYIGKTQPIFRSSWELRCMEMFDRNPSILHWASESFFIPYFNPIKGRQSTYVPDFYLHYIDADNREHSEIIEIKPARETLVEAAKTAEDRVQLAQNMAKWQAAIAWCRTNNMRFRVVNEQHLFLDSAAAAKTKSGRNRRRKV